MTTRFRWHLNCVHCFRPFTSDRAPSARPWTIHRRHARLYPLGNTRRTLTYFAVIRGIFHALLIHYLLSASHRRLKPAPERGRVSGRATVRVCRGVAAHMDHLPRTTRTERPAHACRRRGDEWRHD